MRAEYGDDSSETRGRIALDSEQFSHGHSPTDPSRWSIFGCTRVSLMFVLSNVCLARFCVVKFLCCQIMFGQMFLWSNVKIVKCLFGQILNGKICVWPNVCMVTYVCWVKCFSGQISYGLMFIWSICLVTFCTVKCFSGQIGSKKPATNLVSVWLASF